MSRAYGPRGASRGEAARDTGSASAGSIAPGQHHPEIEQQIVVARPQPLRTAPRVDRPRAIGVDQRRAQPLPRVAVRRVGRSGRPWTQPRRPGRRDAASSNMPRLYQRAGGVGSRRAFPGTSRAASAARPSAALHDAESRCRASGFRLPPRAPARARRRRRADRRCRAARRRASPAARGDVRLRRRRGAQQRDGIGGRRASSRTVAALVRAVRKSGRSRRMRGERVQRLARPALVERVERGVEPLVQGDQTLRIVGSVARRCAAARRSPA